MYDHLLRVRDILAQADYDWHGEEGRGIYPPYLLDVLVRCYYNDSDDATAALIERMVDPEYDDITNICMQVLAQVGNLSIVPQLLNLLQSLDSARRQCAVTVLGQIGNHQTVDALLPLLQDPDLTLRQTVIEALGELRDPRSLPYLISQIYAPNLLVQAQAIHALGSFKDEHVVQILIHLFEESPPVIETDFLVHIEILRALGAIGGPVARQFVRNICTKENIYDESIFYAALRALGVCGEIPTDADFLVSKLQHPLSEFRWVATEVLHRLGYSRAVGALIARLEEDVPSMRVQALRLIEVAKDPQAIPALQAHLSDETRFGRIRIGDLAQKVLASITTSTS